MRVVTVPAILPILPLLVAGCACEGPCTVTRAWVDHTTFGKPEFVVDRIDVRPARADRVAVYRWLHGLPPRSFGHACPPPTMLVTVPSWPPDAPAGMPALPPAPLPLDDEWLPRDEAAEPRGLDLPPPRASWLFAEPTARR